MLQLLAHIGAAPTQLLPRIQRILNRTDGSAAEARKLILPLLAGLGKSGADLLISEPVAVRRQLVRAMGRMVHWGDQVLPILQGVLRDPEMSVRQTALTSVRKWGARASSIRSVVAELLEDPDGDIRELAKTLLADLK